MGRFAVFVDAGYLYVAGAESVCGEKVPRARVNLLEKSVVSNLRSFGEEIAPGSDLLRIYWYDGLSSDGPSEPRLSLAYTADVKMRFGILIESGERTRQKGVDTLLVTDMIELAQRRAMTDAVVLSGDDDVRSGVQIAQSYGIRVHLLGIAPNYENQSNLLLQEADTCSEWGPEQVGRFLSVVDNNSRLWIDVPQASYGKPSLVDGDWTTPIVEALIKSLTRPQLIEIAQQTDSDRVPPEIFGPLLGTCKRTVGRLLDRKEKRQVRDEFKQAARRAVETGTDADEPLIPLEQLAPRCLKSLSHTPSAYEPEPELVVIQV